MLDILDKVERIGTHRVGEYGYGADATTVVYREKKQLCSETNLANIFWFF